MFLVKLFYALIMIGSGAAILKYRRGAKAWMGNFSFAENFLGKGGSYFIVILIGIALIYLGVAYLFGWIEIFPPEEINN